MRKTRNVKVAERMTNLFLSSGMSRAEIAELTGLSGSGINFAMLGASRKSTIKIIADAFDADYAYLAGAGTCHGRNYYGHKEKSISKPRATVTPEIKQEPEAVKAQPVRTDNDLEKLRLENENLKLRLKIKALDMAGE